MKRKFDLKEIHSVIKLVLEKNHLRHQLNNLSEDRIAIKVNRNHQKTIILINRDRHRPFELDVTVDYGLSNQNDLVHISRSNRRKQGGQGMFSQFRLLWLFFIFGGILVSILSPLVGGLSGLIDTILPGLQPNEQAVVVIGSSIAFFLLWMVLSPKIRNYRFKKHKLFDEIILRIVSERLLELIDLNENEGVIRCWSCFEIINPTDSICKHCGKHQK